MKKPPVYSIYPSLGLFHKKAKQAEQAMLESPAGAFCRRVELVVKDAGGRTLKHTVFPSKYAIKELGLAAYARSASRRFMEDISEPGNWPYWDKPSTEIQSIEARLSLLEGELLEEWKGADSL